MLLTFLGLFIFVQTKLESNKVAGSLVVTLIWYLRTSLTDVPDDLQELAPDDDKADVSQARSMLLPCVQALLKGFSSCHAFKPSSRTSAPAGMMGLAS